VDPPGDHERLSGRWRAESSGQSSNRLRRRARSAGGGRAVPGGERRDLRDCAEAWVREPPAECRRISAAAWRPSSQPRKPSSSANRGGSTGAARPRRARPSGRRRWRSASQPRRAHPGSGERVASPAVGGSLRRPSRLATRPSPGRGRTSRPPRATPASPGRRARRPARCALAPGPCAGRERRARPCAAARWGRPPGHRPVAWRSSAPAR
jgi:hypothetical protein